MVLSDFLRGAPAKRPVSFLNLVILVSEFPGKVMSGGLRIEWTLLFAFKKSTA
jgi:hypothetical protein